jgi:hypothetical protein
MKSCSGIKSNHLLFFLLVCMNALSAFAADPITGKVLNQTTNKPAVGDKVILLRLENGMQEESSTQTDAQGSFILQSAGADGYMVRVVHQGVNYDLGVNGKGTLEIAVFDAVQHIDHLQASIGMAQVESDDQTLKVTEMYSISNDSVPPVTQFGPRNFEISIAANSMLDSLNVRRGGGIWTSLAPSPVKGQHGHYAVDFPMRPGDTLFKFVYHVPYTGPTTLHIKPAYPVKSFAVMHPPSMTFKSTQPRTFTSPGEAQGLRVEQVVSNGLVRDVPVFELSGIGVAPARITGSTPATNSAAAAAAAHNPDKPAASSPAAVTERPETAIWFVLSGFAVLILASAYAVWRRRKRTI